MASPKQGLALDELAQHLYDFLPGSRPPYADQRLTFSGVAAELGLGAYWRGGSKQPAMRHLLKIGFKIPELHDPTFLDGLPRQARAGGQTQRDADPKTLAALRDRLMALSTMKPQERGYAFEGFLSELFDAHGLAPRGSFRLTGEQIDGGFQLGQEVYLLEAKWQDARTGEGDLYRRA